MTGELLQRLEDRWMISELLARYASAYDDDKLEDMRSLMTETGVERGERDGAELWTLEGPDAAIAGLTAARAAQPWPGRHVISNLMFDQLDGSDATVRYYLMLVGAPEGTPLLRNFGWYRTTLVKRDGRWLITAKTAFLTV